MQWRCVPELEDAIWHAAKEVLPSSVLSEHVLAEAVTHRSRLYTSEREGLGDASGVRSEDSDVAARALFFTVADAPKIMIPLAELDGRGLLPEGEVRVLDFGAGVGAMTWGLLSFFAQRPQAPTSIRIEAIDRDRRALEIMGKTMRALPAQVTNRAALSTQVAEIGKFRATGTYDLIILGSVLNELAEHHRLASVRALLESLAPDGAMIVIEPALRHTARALHALRDQILEEQAAWVFAPCVRRATPCTALQSATDWCHEDRKTLLPPRASELSNRTHLRQYGLKFAYLVLRNNDRALVDDPDASRVVSTIRRMKGKHECFVCAESGRHRLRILKREVSPENHSLLEAERGDVVCGIREERVAAGDRILRIQPAVPPGERT